MVETGDKIDTNFKLKVLSNGNENQVTFNDLLTRPTVVSVYMKNNTSGCDRQNKSLVEYADKIDDLGYNLVALSKDTCGSHKKYADKLGINYVLASDPDYLFSKATDSIVEKKMYGRTYEGPSRSAYVIDTDGKVLGIIKKVDTRQHGEELIKLLESL
ncbi:MAG TPA: redoxin domain-containing protein [Balneolales bacterium]|nr:redoxin domain-containing protein [Balneolales bacterium]